MSSGKRSRYRAESNRVNMSSLGGTRHTGHPAEPARTEAQAIAGWEPCSNGEGFQEPEDREKAGWSSC